MVNAVKFWPISKLVPYPRNPRLHTQEEVQRLADFITRVGFLKPIEVDESNVILTGHRRRLAALLLGMPEVPVVRHTHLSEPEKRAYRLADNRLTLEGEWDEAALHEEAEFMSGEGWDLTGLGFTEEEVEEALAEVEQEPTGGGDPNYVPASTEKPISELGDVWCMGDHRLLCGDSLNVASLLELLGGVKIALVVTDPVTGDDLDRLVGAALVNARAMCADGAAMYVCASWRTYSKFQTAFAHAGLEIDACIVWNKGWIGLGEAHYRPQHEFILYSAGTWHLGADESDVWNISRDPASAYEHPTQKPVELIERCVLNSSAPNDAVLDVFTGSGSTLIACERRHRQFFGVELAPEYVDVAVRRWQVYTGRRATHLRTGAAFPE